MDNQMKIRKPDIYIKPELKDFGILDFDDSFKILESVEEDARNFKDLLIRKLRIK